MLILKPKSAKLERALEFEFRNKDLLHQALTHSSYAYEHPESGWSDNEVLEFLGDSVVGLAVADFFCAAYPQLAEGDLSKFKSTAASTLALSDLARKIRLDKHILLGRGEEKSGGRKKRTILAGAFEALMGAIYLDQGFQAAKDIIIRLLRSSFKKIKGPEVMINNYKSALQEHFQKENLSPPFYKLIMENGPDHRKNFVVEVCIGSRALAKAKGRSKKSAEQKAAQKALKSLLGKKMKAISEEAFLLKK